MSRVPLPDILKRITGELELLAAEAGKLDQAIAMGLGHASGRDRWHAAHLQRADHLRQHAEDLARFLRVLSPSVPEDITANADTAIEGLQLRALADRLAGIPHSAGNESGDVELL